MDRDDAPVRPLWLDLVVLAFLLGPVLYTANLYPEFPDRIPIHWNARGEPNGWTNRSVFNAFFPGVIAWFVHGLLWLLARDLYWQIGEDARSGGRAAAARGDMLRATVRLIQPLRLILAVMLAAVVLNIPLTIQGVSSPALFTGVMAGSVCCLLVHTSWGVWSAWKAQRQFEKAASGEAPEFEKAHWRLAGAFYHNPDDPTLFVHKRIGFGVTLNMAHPRAKWYGIYAIATLVVACSAVFGLL